MSNDPTSPPSPLTALVDKRPQVATGLAVVGAVLAALAILWGYWGYTKSGATAATTEEGKLIPEEPPAEKKVEETGPKKSPDYQIATVWAGGLALLFLASAGWVYTQPADPTGPMTAARTEVVAFGGVVGLLTAVFGA